VLASNATRRATIAEIVESLGASRIRKDTGRTPVTKDQNMVQVRGIEDRLFPKNSGLVQLSRVFRSLTPEERSDVRHLYNAGQDF